MLSKNQNICNHELVFNMNAGINDVMKVEFLKMNKKTRVHFAVGESFESAEG